MVRVGITGFGRVGRCVFRSAYEHGLDIDWVGINDLADAHTLSQLLRRDTVYGPFPDEVRADDDTLVVGETRIPVFGAGAPGVIPWGEIRAEVVLECTGRFRTRDEPPRISRRGCGKSSYLRRRRAPMPRSCSVSTKTRTILRPTTSYRTLRAPRTASHLSRRCCTSGSASATA